MACDAGLTLASVLLFIGTGNLAATAAEAAAVCCMFDLHFHTNSSRQSVSLELECQSFSPSDVNLLIRVSFEVKQQPSLGCLSPSALTSGVFLSLSLTRYLVLRSTCDYSGKQSKEKPAGGVRENKLLPLLPFESKLNRRVVAASVSLSATRMKKTRKSLVNLEKI